MKISEFIKHLRVIKTEHGDLDVLTANMFGHRKEHAGPFVAYEREYVKGEDAPRFFEDQPATTRGKKVCRV